MKLRTTPLRVAALIVFAVGLLAALLVLGPCRPAHGGVPAPDPTRSVPVEARTLLGTRGPQVDLNSASIAEVRTLPIPREIADAIVDHRTYVAYFTSVYDLMQVPGMTPKWLEVLRPLVFITPVFESRRQEEAEEELRAGDLNFLVQRLLSEEGASEGLTDAYIDQIKDPRDLNRLGYFDLVRYENVSPVDASAVLAERRVSGRIENYRALRAVPGISYWGARNLRDFVNYTSPPELSPRLHFDYQFRLYDTPYVLDDRDVLDENIIGDTNGLTSTQKDNFRNLELNTYAGRLNLDTTDPAMTHKVRARWGDHARAGLLLHRNLGEVSWRETGKGFLALENLTGSESPLGPVKIHSLVVGNYTAAFGLGLVMDATDFFSARRTGLGYSVRPLGLSPDLSRSDEYGMRGVGVDAALGPARGTFFYSRADKDAILNPDGSFNSYFRMVPRLSNDLLAEIRHDIATGVFAGKGDTSAFLPMHRVMDEQIVGSHLQVEARPSTFLGLTGIEIRTRNRAFADPAASLWNPRATTYVLDPARLEDRDSEIGAGYDSRALGNYRRLWGADASTVWRNLWLAGEYGKLETSTEPDAWRRFWSAGPEAKIAQAYLQYENFNVLGLWRDYDLGYDDPYGRAFSEDSRFEQTILDGNAYRLRNPYWAELARTDPAPKAERGWYVNTRYQLTRQFLVSGLEYDSWTRKADGADLSRFAGRLEYRPVFPIRLRVRHAISSRHADRPDDIRAYRSWETRLEMLANLSHYDQLRALLSTGNVTFAERGRLSGPAGGGDVQSDTTAQRGSPSRALQAAFTHQFNDDLAITFSSEIYDGFLYNYEDNEFIVVDGQGVRHWVMLRSRLSSQLSWRLKWTDDHARARTYTDIRNFGALVAPTPDGIDVRNDRQSYRFQIDLSF